MDKTVKILIIACFILVAVLGVSVGFLYNDFLSDKNSISPTVINQSNQTSAPLSTTNSSNSIPKSGNQVTYAGESYKLYNADDFSYAGEALIICPNCGEKVLQNGHETRGGYNYYFFKCSNCGGKFAGYAIA